MSILANALPGFRDIRSALVAGYLWLVFAWIVFGSEVDDARTTYPALQSGVDLANAAGRIWIAVAVGTAAYLVGLVSRDASAALVSFFRRRYREQDDVGTPDDAQDPPLEFRLTQRSRSSGALVASSLLLAAEFVKMMRPLRRVFDLVFAPPTHVGRTSTPEKTDLTVPGADRVVRQLISDRLQRAERLLASTVQRKEERAKRAGRIINACDALATDLSRELDLPATLLAGDRPELFAEADRIRAEGELRVAVVPPLTALAVLLAVEVSPAWLLALLPVAQLLRQGIRREDDVRRLIGSALVQGAVQSAAVQRFDSTLADITTPGGTETASNHPVTPGA